MIPVTDWVGYHARRRPHSVALDGLDTGVSLTWSALEARVAKLAGALRERFGIRAGDRVALIADDDPRVIELQFACIRVEAIFVPLNWRLAPAEIEVLCLEAEPALMVHDDTWQDLAVTVASRENIPQVASWGCADTAADLDKERDRARGVTERLDHTSAQVAQILYTSGTTGQPKGVLVTLGSLVTNTLNMIEGMSLIGRDTRYLSGLPLFHAAGLNVLANPVLMTGGRMSILRRFDPQRVIDLLGDPAGGYTHFNAAPAMYQMMADCPRQGKDFSSVRSAMLGGGRLEPELGDEFGDLGIQIQSAWGSTEMGPNLTLVPKSDRARKAHTVGFPVQHSQLRVVDPATGVDVAPGETGEAWARGPSVCQNYWRHDPVPEGSAHWFRSGDAVTIDEDGFVILSGRFKDMYKSGGENVFAAEVELILADHPLVAEVAIIGVPDPKWGEVGRAIVVPVPGATVKVGDLAAHCAGRLANYKIPKSVATAAILPRNVLGKVQKEVLRRQYGENSRTTT